MKEATRIWKEFFRPSCCGNNSLKMRECVNKHFKFNGKEDCKWYYKCIDLNLKRFEKEVDKVRIKGVASKDGSLYKDETYKA